MSDTKYIERYPHKFRTAKRTGKRVQMTLIPNKDVEDYNKIDVSPNRHTGSL